MIRPLRTVSVAAAAAALALGVAAPAASAQGSLDLFFGSLGGPKTTTAAPAQGTVAAGGEGVDGNQTTADGKLSDAKPQQGPVAEPSATQDSPDVAGLATRAFAGVVTSGVNQMRADANLPRLTTDPALEKHAGEEAARMAREGRVTPVKAPAGVPNYAWNALGVPARTTPDQVVQRFLDEPSLHKVMLDPARTKVGAGFAVAADGQEYIVVDFSA